MKYLIGLSILCSSFFVNGQFIKAGKWQGNIHYETQKVPFTFEVSYPNGEIPQVTFINGEERRVAESVKQEGDTLIIDLAPFDVAIKTVYGAMTMEGFYEKYYRDSKYPFSASFGMPRMMKKSIRPSPPVEERWDMTFDPESSSASKGVGVFKQVGEKITGTVLTMVSDYRYFEGIMDGDSIKLSSFDGAHAFMILGKKVGNEWSGEMIYDNSYSEPWVASPNSEASIDDPFEIVELEAGVHKPYFDLLAAGNGKGTLDPSKYEDKVLIIQLFGTWCPNSHDQTQYLVDWHSQNSEKDVAILASSFEANYSQEYGLRRIEEYKEVNDIKYDVVLGGRLSKS
ncbi:MAG: hypothetical protein AAF391_07550, partial [Bacteroidota bacterium]